MRSALGWYHERSSSPNCLLMGCSVIDRAIGGIQQVGITELTGEAGSGKTQVCLQLCLRAQIKVELGGMSGAAAYLSCGEGEFPFKRLQQLASEFEAIHSIPSSQLLSNIHIENCHNSEIIQESLLHRVPALCRNENLKLLIIDSLAGIVRFEFQAKDMIVARSEYLFKIAQQLKWLADTYKLVIVVVNQVTANFDSALSSSASSAGATSSNPALGLSWSHCISSRIRLYRNRSAFINVNENVSEKQSPRDDKDEISDNKFKSVKSTTSSSTLPSSYTRRLMSLEMSPCRALNQCYFEVRQGGVFGVES